MTHQHNNPPRCLCPQCTESRIKYSAIVNVVHERLEKASKELQGFIGRPPETVQVIGAIPPQFEAVIKATIAEYLEKQNPLKETINSGEKHRLASIRKAAKEADPEEDIWGESDTEDDEPDWLKQEAPKPLEPEEELEDDDDISSLLTLVEALRQQTLAVQRMNAASLAILEVLTEQYELPVQAVRTRASFSLREVPNRPALLLRPRRQILLAL